MPSVLKAHRALRGAPRALAFSARATVCTTTSDALCPALRLSGRPDGESGRPNPPCPRQRTPVSPAQSAFPRRRLPPPACARLLGELAAFLARLPSSHCESGFPDTRVFSTGVKRAWCAARRFLQPWQPTSTAVDRPNPESRVGRDGFPYLVELALFRLCLP